MKLNFRKTKFNSRKIYLFSILLILLAVICTFKIDYFTSAEDDTSTSLASSVYEVLDGVDLSEMETLVKEVDEIDLFKVTIKEKITQILNGEYFTNYPSLFSAIMSLIFGDIRSILPFILTLVAVGVLSNLISNLKSQNTSVSDTINFVFLAVTILIVLVAFKNILSMTSKTLRLILTQMQIVFPILVTLLGTIGTVATISIYNPLVSVLVTIVSIVFEKFLYPLFIVIFILTILGTLTDTVKLNKFINFLMSTFKWSVGIVFTLFTGFLSIQGISAGKFDSVSIKATKFAMKSYIPIIGSYVSDGMDFFVLGASLVKNSIGLVGVIILFITILSPIIMIVIYKLALQLTSGILELTGNNKLANFLSASGKILVLPIVIIIGVAFMYVITITLIMCTANIF